MARNGSLFPARGDLVATAGEVQARGWAWQLNLAGLAETLKLSVISAVGGPKLEPYCLRTQLEDDDDKNQALPVPHPAPIRPSPSSKVPSWRPSASGSAGDRERSVSPINHRPQLRHCLAAVGLGPWIHPHQGRQGHRPLC